MTTLTIEISPRLQQNMQNLIAEGWFKNPDALVEEALRRYLESHSAELASQFIKEELR
ncbi:MAG: CopG family transcriptional regulator [Gammaproteobacteria bacterium]|nr:CopG family transcriptional regulator [Gammaproteobacteria bacterium]